MARSKLNRRKRTKHAIAAKKWRGKKRMDCFITNIVEEIVVSAVNSAENNKQSTKDCKSIVDNLINNVCDTFCDKTPERSHQTADEYDFTWGSLEEYESVSKHNLTISKDTVNTTINDGQYRIVNVQFLINQALRVQVEHSKVCTSGVLLFEREQRHGLASRLIYKCNMCEKDIFIETENPTNEVINKAFVWGTLTTGSTFEHSSELLSVLDVPNMSRNMFFKIQRELGSVWQDSVWEAMEEAGKEEFRIASHQGNVDVNGIAFITVIIDGGWSKRTFGHTYNALSGVAVIIGKETGKLLFLGVKNKFCSICARAEHKAETVRDHLCYKNWSSSSSAMEPAILVEGFNASMTMHNLQYTKFVGDGDSTVYSEIRKKVSYGHKVQKIECTNHSIKNYCKHLYKIKTDTKCVSLAARKMLNKQKIEQLVKTAQNAIYANAHGDINQLKEDLRNSVAHVYGNHTKCLQYMCKNVGDTTVDETTALVASGAHHHIMAAINLLIIKADLLIDKETSNRAELYMSILAKFNMGKRLNLVQRDGFQIRSYLAGLQYNKGYSWHSQSWKRVFHRSPGKNLKKFMTSKEKKLETKHKKQATTSFKPKIRKKLEFVDNKEYGSNIAEVFLNDDELEIEVKHLISRLQVTPNQQKEIASQTVGQFNNPLYLTERQNRLTASNFAAVIKRSNAISCDRLVKQILKTSGVRTAATEYGKKNEMVAISLFEEKFEKKVEPCGLFVDLKTGYLGASPDGITNDNELVEVKCLYKVATLNISLQAAVEQKHAPCLVIDPATNQIKLNRRHDYYVQIQGQLAICQKEICFFVVYSGDKNDLFVEKIYKNEDFWAQNVPILKNFYEQCIAPEIILNKREKGLKCRDPPFIVEAIAKKAELQEKKEKKRKHQEKKQMTRKKNKVS